MDSDFDDDFSEEVSSEHNESIEDKEDSDDSDNNKELRPNESSNDEK